MTCKAHSCPCSAHHKGLCVYHSGQDAYDWPRITETLNNNLRLLKAIQWCFVEGKYKPTKTALEALGRLSGDYPSLTTLEGETAVLWAYRAIGWLKQETKPVRYGDVVSKFMRATGRACG